MSTDSSTDNHSAFEVLHETKEGNVLSRLQKVQGKPKKCGDSEGCEAKGILCCRRKDREVLF